MPLNTTLTHPQLIEIINKIIPSAYGKTRNFVNGEVTYLSPYISRGVISTKQIMDIIIARKIPLYACETFIKELAWRDFFQRTWQHKNLHLDVKQEQEKVTNHKIPSAIVEANIGVEGIDDAINTLYETGYMHNHCRMYTASVACNVAGSHWLQPARWMYYHLLDGDWGSNACSWQWVAGSNSSKKYYANQENISKFTNTKFRKTFLDVHFEEYNKIVNPQHLKVLADYEFVTKLPAKTTLEIDATIPTFVYNYYNMDPLWHASDNGNRILLLEPTEFEKYPVSEKCISFLMQLATQIKGIQIFVGSYAELQYLCGESKMHFKEHPLHKHYKGNQEPRDWMVTAVADYCPSFFGYWKKIEKIIKQSFDAN